jgi:hypothetical protein
MQSEKGGGLWYLPISDQERDPILQISTDAEKVRDTYLSVLGSTGIEPDLTHSLIDSLYLLMMMMMIK